MKNVYQLINDIGKPLTKEQADDKAKREKEEKQEEIKKEYLKFKNKIKELKRNSNIPKRYLNAKLEPITEAQYKLKVKFKQAFNDKHLNDMSDLLIYGSVGTGKTFLTIGLLNVYIQNGLSCRYVTEYELLDLYYQKDFTKFNAFKKVDFLVIDELGKRQLQDWQMIQLEELISYRYNEMLPTVYITNMNQKQFKEFVGDRVIDRLRDNKVITATLDGESLRGK